MVFSGNRIQYFFLLLLPGPVDRDGLVGEEGLLELVLRLGLGEAVEASEMTYFCELYFLICFKGSSRSTMFTIFGEWFRQMRLTSEVPGEEVGLLVGGVVGVDEGRLGRGVVVVGVVVLDVLAGGGVGHDGVGGALLFRDTKFHNKNSSFFVN